MGSIFFKRHFNTGVFCGYCKIFKNSFFCETPLEAASDSPTKYSKDDFEHPCVFNFDQKLMQNVAQILLYYHVIKQFLCCLNWLIRCFRFQNVLEKHLLLLILMKNIHNVLCCKNKYVISCVKRLYLPVLCGWSSAFNLENRKMLRKQKYWIKNMAVKIPIFCSTIV